MKLRFFTVECLREGVIETGSDLDLTPGATVVGLHSQYNKNGIWQVKAVEYVSERIEIVIFWSAAPINVGFYVLWFILLLLVCLGYVTLA